LFWQTILRLLLSLDSRFERCSLVIFLTIHQGARSVVFAGLFATSQDDSALLADAMDKILLTDNSVVARKESSLALGTGYRCGFLGVLHMEVFMQRLLQEYDLEVIATAPTVPYRITDRKGVVTVISNPSEFPESTEHLTVAEPMVKATIVTPSEYVGAVMTLCIEKRAMPEGHEPLGENTTILRYKMPLAEARDFRFSPFFSLCFFRPSRGSLIG
jgi:GTP-binding protein LepA